MPIIIKPNGKELEVNDNTIKVMKEHGALKGFKIKGEEDLVEVLVAAEKKKAKKD